MTHQTLINQLFSSADVKSHPISGGDINAVYRIINERNQESVIKINSSRSFPKMLEKEAQGLDELRKNATLHIPKVHGFGEIEELQYLILEQIEEGEIDANFWEKFGEGLATQHQITAPTFGFISDNYIGSLTQSNKSQSTWSDFTVIERFMPQVKLARDTGKINLTEAKKIERIYPEINNIWPKEKPALLHGDLWAGNYLKGKANKPFLIDPAVYYGHREMDLGMMHLFGGFDVHLFDIYHNHYPLEQGWQDRIKYNQLYPLLVHLNLFGRSYLNQVIEIVKQF
jgi:fructosamine-3-kinase